MKSVVFAALIVSLSFSSLPALAQTCTGGGGNHAGPLGPEENYFPPEQGQAFPSLGDVTNFLNGAAAPSGPTPTTPAAPPARIRVLETVSRSSVPSATIRVVNPTAPIESKSESSNDIAPKDSLDPALAGLVGTWRTVVRHRSGELTTTELQLDNRGRAKLSEPAADGTASTIERRVEFKDQEIKLTEAGDEYVLGKLVSYNDRQLVLERAGGQVTYVRL